MFRNSEDAPQHIETLNCLISDGGIGDLVCSLPAINHIITKCPWINLLVWVPDHLLEFFKHCLPKEAIVRNFTEAAKKYDETKHGISTQWAINGEFRQITPIRTHPVIYNYMTLCDYMPTIEEMSYLKIKPELIDVSKFDLPTNYVVFPAASTERVKTIPKETIDKLSDYVISKGYVPVFLGKTENKTGYGDMAYHAEVQDYDFSKGINLLDKTSILESTAILAKAKLFIGIDGGLSHLCGFTDVPAVIYYSFVTPAHQMPIRNGLIADRIYPIEPDIGCRGCQTKMVQLQYDARKCFYKDYKCVSKEECSPEKFIAKIEEFNLL